jgi:oligopeptide/dipeptide ABC transporter ATP-binding protein
MSLLTVADLQLTYPTPGGSVATPVDGVSFALERGEMLALVGESGCGKSLTGLALLGLIPPPGRVSERSRIRLEDDDLLTLDEAGLRNLRGGRIGMVFQDPTTSLNPVFTAGEQLVEAIRAHHHMSATEARTEARQLLDEVGIPDPDHGLDAYPHQLSGGLRQRVMIAIALAGRPDLLIADEPTTALDVTVQAQILELLDRLRRAHGMAVLLITHDLGIVAGRADRVAVMYAGQIVETAETSSLFRQPSHPYTRGLLRALPRIDQVLGRLTPIPGGVPSPSAWPKGCRFHPRCPEALDRCQHEAPLEARVGPHHLARCWLHAESRA